jgi:hypothetical protein
MTVLYIESWIVKPGFVERHEQLWNSFMRYFRDNPDLFREIKSMRFFAQTSGGSTGEFIQVIEFEDLSKKESLDRRLSSDGVSLKFHDDLQKLKDQATVKVRLWEQVYL